MAARLPLFPLGTVLFPGAALPLHIFEPRYRELIEDLMAGPEPRSFGVIGIREGHEVGADSVRALYDVGCVAELTQVRRFADGRFAVLSVGTQRFRLVGVDESRAYLSGDAELLDESPGDPAAVEDAKAALFAAVASYRQLIGAEPVTGAPDDATLLSYAVAGELQVALPERQALLELPDTVQRLRVEAALLNREAALMRNLHSVPASRPLLPPSSPN